MAIRCFDHFQKVFRIDPDHVWGLEDRKRDEEKRYPNIGDSATNHAVLCVGYDEEAKYLIFLNSWGNRWGDNGRFRVSYDLFQPRGPNRSFVSTSPESFFAGYAYAITDVTVYDFDVHRFQCRGGDVEIEMSDLRLTVYPSGPREARNAYAFRIRPQFIPDSWQVLLYLDYTSFPGMNAISLSMSQTQDIVTIADMFISN